MRTLEQVRAGLKDRNLKAVAEASGVAYGTVRNVMEGKGRVLSETVEKLSAYLDRRDAESGSAPR